MLDCIQITGIESVSFSYLYILNTGKEDTSNTLFFLKPWDSTALIVADLSDGGESVVKGSEKQVHGIFL